MPQSKRTKDEKSKGKSASKKQSNAEDNPKSKLKEKSTTKSDNKQKAISKGKQHQESLCDHVPCDSPILELDEQKIEERCSRFGGFRAKVRRERQAKVIKQQEERIQTLEDQNKSLQQEIYILLEKLNKYQQVSINPDLMLPRSEAFKEEEEREVYFNAVFIPCLNGILLWAKELYHIYKPSHTKIEFSIAGAPNVLINDVLLQKKVLEYLRKHTDNSICFDLVISWGWPKVIFSGNNQKKREIEVNNQKKREIEVTIKINGQRSGKHQDLTQKQEEREAKMFEQHLKNIRCNGNLYTLKPSF